MEDQADILPEQMEKIVQYQEVTGLEDLSDVRRNLSEHEWNVEAAVQQHLALEEHQQQEALDNSVNSNLGGAATPNSSDAGRPPASGGVLMSQRAVVTSVLRWCYHLLSFPMNIICSFLYSLFVPTNSHRTSDSVSDAVDFIRHFENEFGSSHPPFYEGSYNQALSHAKSELKFLVVYLHCPQHQDTDRFCRDVLSQRSVISYLSSSAVTWGASVWTSEGGKASHALGDVSYPFVAIAVLRRQRMTVVARLQGARQAMGEGDYAQGFIRQVRAVVEQNEGHLTAARADRQERRMAAALRQEQDDAYQESLKADREKAQKRREEEEARLQQERDEGDRLRGIEHELERRQALKVEWANRIPKEPAEGDADAVEIVAKLPNGARLSRRFALDQPLTSLFYYIFCHPNSPDRFQVTTNFPRKVVPCDVPLHGDEGGEVSQETFSSFGIHRSTMLFVIDLDA